MDLIEKCLNKNYIFKGKVVSLRKDTVELPDGEHAFREVVEHSGGVCVLAIDKNDDILFVEQYRYPYEEILLEIPAGRLEKGEDARQCGIRELSEETGAAAKSFQRLCEFYPTAGYSDERIFIFTAKDLTFEETHFDEDEFLNLKRIPLKKALEMVCCGEIKDAKTIIALLLYDKKLKTEI